MPNSEGLSVSQMNASALIDALERFANVLPVVVQGIDDDDVRWRPDDASWSILEIVTHLADEEIEDFRRRLELTLRDATADWPPIDPQGWAKDRQYNEGHLEKSVQRFVNERRDSIAWLRGLDTPDWSATYTHPQLGSMTAGDLLASWAAHDVLHLRQLARRLHQLATRNAGDCSPAYAGEW
jgi:hypothetical protein